jgi:hypothetical protein
MTTRVVDSVTIDFNSTAAGLVVFSDVSPYIVVYKPYDAAASILSSLLDFNLVPISDATGVPDYFKRFTDSSLLRIDTEHLISFVVSAAVPPLAEPHKRFPNAESNIALNSLSVSSTPTPPQILPAPGNLFPLQGIFLMEPLGTPGP